MRILVLSTWFPYPPDNGAKIRIYHLLRELAKRHHITLLTFMPTAAERCYIPALQAFCTDVQVLQRDPFQRDRLKALMGFFSPRPRSVVSTYSKAMELSLHSLLTQDTYDMLIASQMGTAPYVAAIPSVPKVFDDVETSVIRDAYLSAPPGSARIRRWLTWIKFQRCIRSLTVQFDACTVASEQERANLQRIAPFCRDLAVIPNGVDLDWCSPGIAEPRPNTLVFNGSLTFSANYDAMRYFLSEIFPRIRAEFPEVTLKITGSTARVALDALPLDENVTLTGYVEDIRPVVAGSWACVVPLRIGGGTRLKILEAMALGTPVVATSKGAEGLDVTPGQNILIADDPARFAAQTLHLLRDANLRQQLAQNGRKLVEEKYSWTKIGQKLNDVLESVVQARRSR